MPATPTPDLEAGAPMVMQFVRCMAIKTEFGKICAGGIMAL